MEIQNNSNLKNKSNSYFNLRNAFGFKFSRMILIVLIFQSILINMINSREAKSHLVQEEEFPELSEEEIMRAKQQFMNEEDVDQKCYLEPIVKPENFDLNRDRRISKEEVKKAIKYCIFPKESSRRKKITEELKNHVNNQVDLFVNGLNFDSLTYRQFGKFMNRIVADNFINFETMTNVHMIPKDYREITNDL